MTDLLGPASAPNAVTARPSDTRVFGGTDTWFKDCTTPTADDGTDIQSGFLNGQLAQTRRAIRGMGVTENNADDDMLLKAIQSTLANGQVFTSSGNFTVPTGVTRIKARVWGSGGGGGGAGPTAGGGGGGGGGGYAEGWFSVTPGQVIAVTVATGGTAGATTPTNGGAGGTSSLGGLISATGGNGGTAGNGASGSPGNGGTGTGGALQSAGRTGSFPSVFASIGWTGGLGGAAFGGGYTHWTMNDQGAAGLFPGGGGGGAGAFNVAKVGGAGANGLVIIEW